MLRFFQSLVASRFFIAVHRHRIGALLDKSVSVGNTRTIPSNPAGWSDKFGEGRTLVRGISVHDLSVPATVTS